MSQLLLAELIGALSHALDLTEGQPEGHGLRSCWIGMHVGEAMGMDADELWSLYYTLLLKDLGCSSNAARICELYMVDDRSFKHDFKLAGTGRRQLLGFMAAHSAPHARWRRRVMTLVGNVRKGGRIAQELIETRCTRGADIARRLRFPETVANAIHALDEHFDGSGRPMQLRGAAIPLASRIALLAQVVDVFQFSHGPTAAVAEVRKRSGRWFDPQVVQAFVQVARSEHFWSTLSHPELATHVLRLEPGDDAVPLDDDYLDAIAEAFGAVIDAKSPFTSGHSERVGYYTDGLAERLDVDPARRRWLRRAALLHDVGKLGVSNTILDKRGPLDAAEWQQVRQHAVYSEQILSRLTPFAELARIAGAHHERLDGSGYPRGLRGNEIARETRIITAADIFDAITAERPYHPPCSAERALDIMRREVGVAIDAECFDALESMMGVELVA